MLNWRNVNKELTLQEVRMVDLMAAILILFTSSATVGAIGFQLGRRFTRSTRIKLQLLVAALLVLYLSFIWEQPVLTRLLPVSSLVILGNWLPLYASFWLGMLMANNKVTFGRRVALSCLATTAVAFSIINPLTGQAPECRSAAEGVFQSQTTRFTCSAASAATLLRLHQIPATEQELAQLCLTRVGAGTGWMGVYRGLSLKTEGTPWKVVAAPIRQEHLSSIDGTCLLSVDVDTSNYPDHFDHGFNDLVGHTIVCLGQSREGCLDVFDPSPEYGMEIWGPSTFVGIEGGVMMKLVPRDGSGQLVDGRNLVAHQ